METVGIYLTDDNRVSLCYPTCTVSFNRISSASRKRLLHLTRNVKRYNHHPAISGEIVIHRKRQYRSRYKINTK